MSESQVAIGFWVNDNNIRIILPIGDWTDSASANDTSDTITSSGPAKWTSDCWLSPTFCTLPIPSIVSPIGSSESFSL